MVHPSLLACSLASCLALAQAVAAEPARLATSEKTFQYTLRAGETLNDVARIFRVPVGDLIELNRIRDPDRLAVGLRVVVPNAFAQEAAEAHDVGEEGRVVAQRVVLDLPDLAHDVFLREELAGRAREEEEQALEQRAAAQIGHCLAPPVDLLGRAVDHQLTLAEAQGRGLRVRREAGAAVGRDDAERRLSAHAQLGQDAIRGDALALGHGRQRRVRDRVQTIGARRIARLARHQRRGRRRHVALHREPRGRREGDGARERHGEDAEPTHHHEHSRAGALIVVGDTVHNFVDGVLIAAAFLQGPEVGLVTAVAIVAHEIPQEVGDFLVLLHSGYTRARAFALNIVSSLGSVVGGVLGYFVLEGFEDWEPTLLGVVAASMIYVAVADLIPGLHKRPELRATAQQALLIAAGVGVIFFVR